MSKLDRFIKNKLGDKSPQVTTSVNIEARHLDFLRRHNLNLSGMVRDMLDSLLKEEGDNGASEL